MKKKKILFVILAVVLAFSIIITVISISQYRTKTITNFYNNDVNKIDKINITNGTNGNIVTVTDKKMISSICNYLSKLKFNKIRSQPSTGWSYNISVIENKKDVVNIEFISDDLCIFNRNSKKYDIQRSDKTTLESIYNNAKSLKTK